MRHQHATTAQVVGEGARVQRPGASERDEREVARIVAALDRDDAKRPEHFRVHDVDHIGRIDVAERPGGCLPVELQPTGQLRRQPSQQQVRVGYRRRQPAASVARRPRRRPGAPRADAEGAPRVPPDDRTAARTDGMDIDHRDADREAGDLASLGPLAAATGDQAHVRGRAAHVEGDHVLDARQGRDPLRADHPRRRSGDEDHHRMRRRLVDCCDTPGGAHHERLGEAGRDDIAAECPNVAGDDGPEVGVGDGRRGALVLTELGRDLVRGDDVHTWMTPSQLFRHRVLVRRVAEREQEADRDCLRIDVAERRDVERGDDAVRPHPLAHGVALLERDERLGVVDVEPVEVRPVLASQVQKVLEALGGDERRARSLPLEQRVRRDRRAVGEPLDIRAPCGLEHESGCLDDRLHLPRASDHLRRVERSAVEQHGVGERAAHVDAENRHQSSCTSASANRAVRRSSPPSAVT